MRRARAAVLPIVRPDLVEFYLAHRAAQGMNTDHKVRWGARALLAAAACRWNVSSPSTTRPIGSSAGLRSRDGCSRAPTNWSHGARGWG